MKSKPFGRAYTAGQEMGEAVVEMIHLMYQKNTALNFITGLISVLNAEYRRRLKEARL